MKRTKKAISTLLAITITLSLMFTAAFNFCSVSAKDNIGDVYIWSTMLARSDYSSYANNMITVYQNMNASVTTAFPTEEQHFNGDEDLADSYDMVVLYLPSAALNDNDIAVLQKFVNAGGRVALQAEWPGMAAAENEILSEAAKKLGATFRITDTIIGCRGAAFYNNPESDIMKDVNNLQASAAAKIEYEQPSVWACKADYTLAPDYVVDSTQQGVWVLDQAAGKGRLTVFSDVNFYYSRSVDDVDVIQFFRNLLTNAQENKVLVKEGKDPNASFGEGAKANISDVVINGDKDSVVNKEITLTIEKDAFNAITAGTDVSAWFDLPEGLTATVKNDVEDLTTEMVITISGTVTEEKSGSIVANIPDTALKSGKTLAVIENENAVIEKHECANSLTLVPAKEATFTADGNTAYYICECGKLYSDAKGTKEIKLADTIVEKLVLTKVPATEATPTTEGNIEYYVAKDGKLYSDANSTKEITLEDTVISKLVVNPNTGCTYYTSLIIALLLVCVAAYAVINIKAKKAND